MLFGRDFSPFLPIHSVFFAPQETFSRFAKKKAVRNLRFFFSPSRFCIYKKINVVYMLRFFFPRERATNFFFFFGRILLRVLSSGRRWEYGRRRVNAVGTPVYYRPYAPATIYYMLGTSRAAVTLLLRDIVAEMRNFPVRGQ